MKLEVPIQKYSAQVVSCKDVKRLGT